MRRKIPILATKTLDVAREMDQYRQWIDQLLDDGKTVQVAVHGMSMFPLLLPGDKVQIRKSEFEQIRPGQVVVFEKEGNWIAHRVMVKDKKQSNLITHGDGLPRNDEPISFQNVKGTILKVVKSRSPFSRTINTFVDRWMVWLAPVTGRLFWYAGRVVVWGLKRLKGLRGLMC